MIVIRRSIYAVNIAAGADNVIGSAPIPKGGKIMSVQGEIHVNGEESQDTGLFSAYGFSAHLVPLEDPETALTLDELWDDVVVKAIDPVTAAGAVGIDIDWITTVGAPEIEPGEMDVTDLLGMSQGSKELIAPRLEWISWAKSRQGGWAAGTPDTFFPSDYKTFKSEKTLAADAPSEVLIGFSSPSLDDLKLQSADVSFSSAAEWYMLQNMDSTLEDMAKAQAGLTEAGAESPYANASTLLEEVLAPPMVDESVASLYNTLAYDVLCVSTFVLEYPNSSIPKGAIDAR